LGAAPRLGFGVSAPRLIGVYAVGGDAAYDWFDYNEVAATQRET